MAVGYDSIMQPFGQTGAGQDRGRIQPGDRLPDGSVYQPPDNSAWYQQEIHKLDTMIADLEERKAKYQEKLDELNPPKKTAAKKTSSSRKKSKDNEESSDE